MKRLLIILAWVIGVPFLGYLSVRVFETRKADAVSDTFFVGFKDLKTDYTSTFTSELKIDENTQSILDRHQAAIRNLDYPKVVPHVNAALNAATIDTSWHLIIHMTKQDSKWLISNFEEFETESPVVDELVNFNQVLGLLHIEFEDLRAKTKKTKIKSVKLEPHILDLTLNDHAALTEAQLNSIAYRHSTINLVGLAGVPVLHKAPNGKHFSCRDLLDAVEETERQTRDKTDWFGGVDAHHIFYEGIDLVRPGLWRIMWGS